MFSRPRFALFLCIVILTAFSNGKPQNSSIKPAVKTNRDQSIVVNNNCGLAKSESKMLAHIKVTVDSIAANSSKGIYLQMLIFSRSVKNCRISLLYFVRAKTVSFRSRIMWGKQNPFGIRSFKLKSEKDITWGLKNNRNLTCKSLSCHNNSTDMSKYL